MVRMICILKISHMHKLYAKLCNDPEMTEKDLAQANTVIQEEECKKRLHSSTVGRKLFGTCPMQGPVR
jgi:hypothetical protein